MNLKVSGWLAAIAIFASAAPAMACGGFAGCSPCGEWADSCAGGYAGPYYFGHGHYQHLADPDAWFAPAAPQYFYVNQGPMFTGPGMFAPVPTYRERAVTGWHGYDRGYYYGYNGGPYANAMHHYYDGAPDWHGPAIYSYRWRHRHGRPGLRHGHHGHHHRHHAYSHAGHH